MPDDAADVPDLPTLIRERLDRGDTLQSLQAKSGGVVKYQRWGQLSKGQRLNEFPEPATLAAIARALNITETVAVISTAKALGMDVSRRGSTFAHRLPGNVDNLPPAVQGALVELIGAMSEENRVVDLRIASMEDRRDDLQEPPGTPEPEEP